VKLLQRLNVNSAATPGKGISYLICLFAIFFLAVVLRVTFTDMTRVIPGGDEATYHNAALAILEYGTLTRDVDGSMINGSSPLFATSALSPGYPMYLAAVYSVLGTSTQNVFFSQLLMSLLSLWLIYKIMDFMNVNRAGILVALMLAAVYPGFIYNINRLLTEQIFVVLMLGYAYTFLLGWRRASTGMILFSAILLTFATHVRGQALPFALLSVYILIVYERSGKKTAAVHAAAFIGVIFLLMLPWWIRNCVTIGHFILISDAGDGAKKWGAVPYFIDMRSSLSDLASIISNNMTPNPPVFYKWRVFGFLQFMWGDVWDEQLVHPGAIMRFLLIIQYVAVVPALIALPLIVARRSAQVLFIAVFPVAITIMNFPFHGLPRYVFAGVPFLFIILGVGISYLSDPRLTENAPAESAPGTQPARGLDGIGRVAFIAGAGVLSILVAYSVYFFAYKENEEMSAYRMSRYMGLDAQEVAKGKLIESRIYEGASLIVANTKKKGNKFISNADAASILDIYDSAAAPFGAKVASVVTMNMQGGYLFDYTTIYWSGVKADKISEYMVYKFPNNMFISSRTVVIDDDVMHLLIVPYVFRGARFHISSIVIKKYLLNG
jgi:hypothetical protein